MVVKCRNCGAEQPHLRVVDGKLMADTAVIIGFVCQRCGKVMRWGIASKQVEIAVRKKGGE